MALSAGSQLGPYRITALLGAGGMGEVYRARDERLERDVAIKVLLDEAASDADLQRRFALEARAASALNHPNLLTIHDVGSQRGVSYIVSELIEGEPLRAIIARGPIPLRKVLDIAVQVAAGLAVAHHAGIVHRDLKPANLMVTKDGQAKILDFGLAKRVRAAAGGAPNDPATAPGFLVGTATYMSPEQVQGTDLDHRSDQFAFGLVLYEMITGKAAFARGSAVSTMMAIMEEQAQPIAEVNPAIPPPVLWCIERCMAKERDGRYTSTSDLHRELQTIWRRLDEVSTSRAAVVAAPPTAALPTRKRRPVWPVVLGLAGLITGYLATELLLFPDALVDMRSYKVRPLISSGANESSPVWSADGRSIAYTADVNGIRQVFVRDIQSPMSAEVTNSTSDCERPFWSPDGNKIFYFSAGAGGIDALRSVGATGGSPEAVQDNASAASIARDGKTLAFLRTDSTGKEPLSLWFSTLGGGSPRRYTAGPFASGKFQFGYIAFTPDGKALGVWLARWDGRSELWVLPYPEGTPREPFSLVQGTYPFSWMPDNRHIVFGGVVPGSMGADLQTIDTKRGSIRPLSMLTRDALEASASPDGATIAFNAEESDFDLISVPLDGSAIRPLLATPRNELDPMWSPSGDQLVYSTDRTGTSQIWLKSPREGWERPLVTEKDFDQTWIASFGEPVFSPDGRRIAYSVVGDSGHAIYISSVAGGKPVRLSTDTSDQRSATWNADGAWIAYLQNINGSWTLVKAQSGGGAQPVVLRQGVLPAHPKWNRATGHSIACMTGDGLTLISDDGKESRALSKDPWLVFGWSVDGTFLYGVKQLSDRRRQIVSLDVASLSEKVIGELPLPAAAELRSFSLSPDGKSFATSASRPRSSIWLLEGFRNPGLLGRLR
jgi:serine/threonine protein kinase/WD40 repeat protein